MLGQRLSHFQITDEIGAGGMGIVYRAIDLKLQRPVALKVLPPEPGPDSERRRRFLREAQAASALNHPNIVTVYEIDSAEGLDFIAMELVPGRSLEAEIDGRGLPLPRVVSHAMQMADALARAHAHGIVHRDLKPRNVMVTPEGGIKVLDFGIAKRTAPQAIGRADPTQDVAPQTLEGVVVGTPQYMSPEQAEGRSVDARSDVFSLGAVLYEMLTGRPPFQGATAAQVLTAVLRDEPAAIFTLRSDLPAEVGRIVAKALEKDPAYRYQHMEDLLADLKALQRGTTLAASATVPPPPRRWVRMAAVAAVVGVLGGAATALWLGRRPRGPTPSRFRLAHDAPGARWTPSFSPDARMIAFLSDAGGVPQVWVQPLGGGEPVAVTSGPMAAGRPRWSPKGDQIVFERGHGIWAVGALGGPARRIVEEGSCPAFFPDGERLVFDRGRELWTTRVDGSQARPVEGVPANFFSSYVTRCAAVSPDGRSIAYYQPERGPAGDYWIVDADGGPPRRLTHDSAEGGSLAWTPDGRFVVFSSARKGSRTLWRIAAAGGTPEAVTTGSGDDVEPAISPDGARLAYGTSRHAHAIMVLEAATGQQREVLERRGHLNGPRFSPDGGRIAFFAATDSLEQVFTVGTDGRDLRQITQARGVGNIMPTWSADGQALYFYQQLDPPAFRKVPVAGGPSVLVLPEWTWPVQNQAEVDPAGGQVAYSLLEGPRVKAALVRDLRTGRERPLGQPLADMRWSRDGRRLVGQGSDGHVVVCPAAGPDPCQSLAPGFFPTWSGDGSRIYFHREGPGLDDPDLRAWEVWVMERDGTRPRRVSVTQPVVAMAMGADASVRDELVWIQFRRGRQEIWLADLEP